MSKRGVGRREEVDGPHESKTRWRRALMEQGNCGKFSTSRDQRNRQGKAERMRGTKEKVG